MDSPYDYTEMHPSLAPLSAIESTLRCSICKDFYQDPLTAEFSGGCKHSFCSLCWRTYFSNSSGSANKCPDCGFEIKDIASGLKKNVGLSCVVETFKAQREELLNALKNLTRTQKHEESNHDDGEEKKMRKSKPSIVKKTSSGSSRNSGEDSDDDFVPESSQRSSTRSSRKRKRNGTATRLSSDQIATSCSTTQDEIIVLDEADFPFFESTSSKSKTQRNIHHSKQKDASIIPGDQEVTCPICDKTLPFAALNSHIDRNCADETVSTKRITNNAISAVDQKKIESFFSGDARTSRNGISKISARNKCAKKYLSSIAYDTISLSVLRRKLEELGIPSYGDKKQLESRHKHFRNLYNANLDRDDPRPFSHLLSELNAWERLQSQSNGASISSNNHEDTREDAKKREEWKEMYGDQFKELMERAKVKRKEKVKIEEVGNKIGDGSLEDVGQSKPVSWINLGIGAVIQTAEVSTLGQPFEVVKTHMAAHRGEGLVSAVKSIYQRGGLAGFWAGLIPWAWIEASTKGAVLLFASSEIEYHSKVAGFSAPVAGVLGGMGGGVAQAYTTMGFCTFMKTVEVTRHKTEGAHKTTFQVAAEIFKREGIVGMNKGVSAVALRQMTNWGSRLGISRITESTIHSFLPESERNKPLPTGYKLLSSVIGGALACWNQPIEVIRVEMQSQVKSADRPAKMSIANVARYIYQRDGLIGFYRGVTPRIGLGVYLTVCMVFGGDELKRYAANWDKERRAKKALEK
ncbi:Mitochondrial DNA replication protein yhm2 [Nowakowskiella sp. JEL0407]|nr:Mitochondrial DNA replication protein yhm2 [Nowakowskiella sp. JEL0407]